MGNKDDGSIIHEVEREGGLLSVVFSDVMHGWSSAGEWATVYFTVDDARRLIAILSEFEKGAA